MNSQSGGHIWINDFGNDRLIDTRAYASANPSYFTSQIIFLEADLSITKQLSGILYRSGFINYILTVTNDGPSFSTAAVLHDTFVSKFLNPSWSCIVVA